MCVRLENLCASAFETCESVLCSPKEVEDFLLFNPKRHDLVEVDFQMLAGMVVVVWVCA